jgi:large subunit ribosomal protein L29
MDAKELRAKSPDELNKELSELLRAHFGLRMQHATQQLANTSELRKTRRSIARVRTVLREQAKTTKAQKS